MIEQALAADGYKSTAKSTGSARSIEYRIFARVTGQLASVPEDAPDRFARTAEAVHSNLELWTAIANDVANEGNALPNELRSKLFYLFEFTRHHSARVLTGEAKPAILVEINTAIMRGLRGESETRAAAP